MNARDGQSTCHVDVAAVLFVAMLLMSRFALTRQYEIARLDEAREGALIQVVDAAVPPQRKSRPKRALVAVVTTVAVGLVLVVFVFLRRAWINTQADAEGAQKIAALRAAFGRART